MSRRYLSAERMSKDDFGIPFTKETGEVVYDAVTQDGRWATMTVASFMLYSKQLLGIGLGQKYTRRENGELHLTEGGS